MSVFGTFLAINKSIDDTENDLIELADTVSSEKTLRINVGTSDGVKLLMTTANSSEVAGVAIGYTLPTGETELTVGRSLDRLSFYNGSGSTANVSVAVLY